ncbi:CPBP family intramembrane glutamic endopeptidase [Neolewinella litorea]|uniref:CPBP family intramembrane metalloprotease n=1 Tax=Neolewinella litorea TaxID=2562452 RepID=A0A4S4NU99_9BACT|nr:CPBP family intramembrane glutamic endopeptidase [Neolewinella litorea]THH42081.1 CPBP family intramembrane metalloprotease [Neolewinella litorea]
MTPVTVRQNGTILLTVGWVSYALIMGFLSNLLANGIEGKGTIIHFSFRVLALLPPVCYLVYRVSRRRWRPRQSMDFSLVFLFAVALFLFLAIPLFKLEFPFHPGCMVLATTGTLVLVTFEELVFRVLPFRRPVLGGLRRRQHTYALLFGLAHLGNLLYTGDLMLTLSQVCLAYGLGMILSAVYLRYGRVRHVVVFHFLVNITKEYDLLCSREAVPLVPLQDISWAVHELLPFSVLLGGLLAAASHAILPADTVTRLQRAPAT